MTAAAIATTATVEAATITRPLYHRYLRAKRWPLPLNFFEERRLPPPPLWHEKRLFVNPGRVLATRLEVFQAQENDPPWVSQSSSQPPRRTTRRVTSPSRSGLRRKAGLWLEWRRDSAAY
jgi:hypothetical protein